MQRHWADITFLLLSAALLAWVGWDSFSFRLITFSSGSDYWEHTAVLHALMQDPIHPRHPLIADAVSSPRFGPHALFTALVGRLFGLDALGAMGVAAVLNTLLFLAGIWLFFRVYFRDPRAPLFGLVVLFCSWFDAPHFSNVYQLDIYFSVAGYPSTTALGLTLLGLAWTVTLLGRGRLRPITLVGFALLWTDVYVTHPLTATMGLPAAALLALTEPGVALRRRLELVAGVAAGFLASALWPYYPALGMVIGGTAGRVKHDLAAGGVALHPFYSPAMLWRIVGYTAVALPLLPYFVLRRRLLFVPLGTALMLAAFALTAFVPIPLGHRYVLLSMLFLQIGLVWLLLAAWPAEAPADIRGRPWLRRSLAAAVLLSLLMLVVQNVEMAYERFARVSPRLVPRESLVVRVGRRVSALAGDDAVVLGTPLESWSLPTFGPKVVTLHHRNPLIKDADQRARDAARFFAPGASDSERMAILKRYRVTHVIGSVRPRSRVGRFLAEHALEHHLPGRSDLYEIDSPASIDPG